MNEWIRKSIEFANSPGYLDRLYEVYPIVQGLERKIDEKVKNELKRIYDSGNDTTLIKRLLELPKFPVNDPYVAFLRKNKNFLEYNPQTVNRIAQQIKAMGFDAMIDGVTQPKVSTKQLGTLFKKWIPKIGYSILPVDEFEASEGIAFLQGSDALLKNFANRRLDCELDKGLDFLAKVRDIYVIGEAKFLTDYGGAQNANFEDALRLIKSKKGKAIRIDVLDGVVWIKNSTKMFNTVCNLKEVALTALLLKEFLESI